MTSLSTGDKTHTEIPHQHGVKKNLLSFYKKKEYNTLVGDMFVPFLGQNEIISHHVILRTANDLMQALIDKTTDIESKVEQEMSWDTPIKNPEKHESEVRKLAILHNTITEIALLLWHHKKWKYTLHESLIKDAHEVVAHTQKRLWETMLNFNITPKELNEMEALQLQKYGRLITWDTHWNTIHGTFLYDTYQIPHMENEHISHYR